MQDQSGKKAEQLASGAVVKSVGHVTSFSSPRARNLSGLLVALLSPDGGGKTAVAKGVLESLSANFKRTKYLYWRPGVLPEIRDLVRLRFHHGEPRTNLDPHGRKTQGRMVSMFRFFYYSCDYMLGFITLSHLRRMGTLIVMDRYYYDFLIDRKRYGFNISGNLPKLILNLVSKPDVVIYLDNSPSNLHARKPELTLAELDRQIKLFRKLIKTLPNSHVVNTDKPLETVVQEVCELIMRRNLEMVDYGN